MSQNPTDRVIEAHTWPDGDWLHDTCRCGAPHPCDTGIAARAARTALHEAEQLAFDRWRLQCADQVVQAARDLRTECQTGIGFDNLVARINAVFVALATYEEETKRA